MRWMRKELPNTNFWKVQQEDQDEWICVIFHMPYMLSVTVHMLQKIGGILYQLKLIGCDILYVQLA